MTDRHELTLTLHGLDEFNDEVDAAVFWFVGGIDQAVFAAAEKAGSVDALPGNHAPDFAPAIHPTLRTGVEAMLTAAGVWLAGVAAKA
jgi:hypothetical protein